MLRADEVIASVEQKVEAKVAQAGQRLILLKAEATTTTLAWFLAQIDLLVRERPLKSVWQVGGKECHMDGKREHSTDAHVRFTGS